jgi:hypothetical protein
MKCANKVELKSSDLVEESRITKDGIFHLTFHKCPACHRKVLVQIDDEETKALAADVNVLVTKKMARMIRHQDMPKKQLAKLDELNKQLDHKRKALNSNYWTTFDLTNGEEAIRN